MILNYSVTLSDWRSTTASSETPPLFMTVGQSVCLTDWLTDWLTQGLTIWPNDSFIDFPTGKTTSQLICCSKHFLLYWKYILNFTGVNQVLKESSDWTVLLPVSASEWLALTSLLNRWELPPCYRPNSCQWRTNVSRESDQCVGDGDTSGQEDAQNTQNYFVKVYFRMNEACV